MLDFVNYFLQRSLGLLTIDGSRYNGPGMSTPTRVDPATEAWSLALEIVFSEKPPRVPAVAAEFDLSPMAMKLLYMLEPGAAEPMSALAESLFCDASNVTGIVDRLEARELIERRDNPRDRRVKLIALTNEGAVVRERIRQRMHEPPEQIAALSRDDKRTLRDVLRRAVNCC
jgi:MarR family transcriptional regulator, organic hydroperoxide resistance regulator